MAALLFLSALWASCASLLSAHVYRLPLFQHAPVPLVARETFKPVPHRRPLPHGLSALLLPPAGRQPHGGTGPSAPPGPVEVWCGLRRVGVRADRQRLRYWRDPRLFRLGSCGVSAASPRYLYFHRGLKECGGSVQVVNGQLVYAFPLTYGTHHYGPVLRAPPLNMVLSCHYNRFHYSYRVGFQPQAPPTTFLKSVRSQNSFSLSVCDSQWEVLPPDYSFVLGEPVFFKAQTGPLRAGERLYVDSCHVTSSSNPNSAPGLDIISNFGCMVDSTRADSNSHFHSRGPSELRFSVDSLLFKAEGQMLFLHCSMSVGLQPSASSKSCTFNKALGRWLELEASPSLCSCCDSVCEELNEADRTTVSSAAWYMERAADRLYHHKSSLSMKKEQGLTEELHQGAVSTKWTESDLTNSIHEDQHLKLVSLKELHKETVNLKSVGLGFTNLHEKALSPRSGGPGLTTELHKETVNLKNREKGLKNELPEETVNLKSGVPGLTNELHEETVFPRSGGPGLSKELHEETVSLKSGGPGLSRELHENDISPKSSGPGLITELHEEAVSELNLTKALHQGTVSFKMTKTDLTELTEAKQSPERQLREGDHTAHSQGGGPEKDSAMEFTDAWAQVDKVLFKSALTGQTAGQNAETEPQFVKVLFRSALTNQTAAQTTVRPQEHDKTLMNHTADQNTDTQPQHDKTLMNHTAVQHTDTQPQHDKTLFKYAPTNLTAAQNHSVSG